MTEQKFSFEQYPEQIAVVRFGPGANIPAWAESSSVFSIVATATHTTVVCAARNVPTKARHVRSFTAFGVKSESALEDFGVYAAILAPLLEAEIAAVPLATFDEPWVLVPQKSANRAADAWRSKGHTVAPAVPV